MGRVFEIHPRGAGELEDAARLSKTEAWLRSPRPCGEVAISRDCQL